MKFELNELNRNIPDDTLLNDLKEVSIRLSKKYISRSQYEKNGKYSATPFVNRFGSWIESLKAAGLQTERDRNDFKRNSDEALLKDLIQVANHLQKTTLTTSEYKVYGKYSTQTILSRFDSWDKALNSANLEKTGFVHSVETQELLDEIESVWIQLGRQPTSSDIKNGLFKHSLNTYSRKFGGWRKALEAFIEYINEENSELNEVIKEKDIIENTKEPISKIQRKQRRTTRDINTRLRFSVFKRDNFKCVCCGRSPAMDPQVVLHVDHILPWSKNGETILENLQTLCSKCNLGKSDL